MRWLNHAIDWTAESFGGLGFLAGYNVVTFVWVGLGMVDRHWFDPYPSNFYTLSVSWLAINMSSLLLWSDRRKAAKERAMERHQAQTLDTLLALAEADAAQIPLIRQIAQSQVIILDELQAREHAQEVTPCQ
ncbi:MAG: DUF1003 domain-containing protein [Alicyclobacillus sp.]|nr:DUF1003 domain-containing protein [Alicyclobacillus sp.]